MIYFDNAATTYPKPECVYKRLDMANRNAFNTGRGSYDVAKEASKIKENVRDKILKLNNLSEGKVIYECSATRALNDIIFGLDLKNNDNIYISPFEHNSIIRPLEELKTRIGINIIELPFDKKKWYSDLDKTNNLFAIQRPTAIILSHISNVTGFMVPYNEIFEIGKKYNSINILDSAQGYGIVKIDNVKNINYIVFAGHKSLYGSFGIAGFIKLRDDILKHNVFGGTGSDTMNFNMSDSYPEGYEAGSSNIVAISSLDASIDWLMENDIFLHEKELTKYLINELKKINKIKVFIPENYDRIFGVVSIAVEGYSSEEVGQILNDEFNICVRTGYHCSPLIHKFIESTNYLGTIRISLSYFSTKNEINTLIEALKTL